VATSRSDRDGVSASVDVSRCAIDASSCADLGSAGGGSTGGATGVGSAGCVTTGAGGDATLVAGANLKTAR